MSKSRTSVSLDEDIADYLSREDVNGSGLVNRLLKQHIAGGGSERQMLELRIQQVESELKELESRKEQKASELEALKERLDDHSEDREETLIAAAETLVPKMLTEDNPAVNNWAEKAGISVSEFLDEMDDRMEGGR